MHYECLFTSAQKWLLFKHFKLPNGYFAVVNLYIFEETCILLELLFHAKLNGLLFNSIY